MRVFITEKDNFLTNTENIKLGSITEKLNGSKMCCSRERGINIKSIKLIYSNTEEFLTSNCLHSSTDRTSGYGLEDRGSNPLGDTKKSLIVISKVCNDINIVG